MSSKWLQWPAFVTASLLLGCEGASAGVVASPFGVWETRQGHRLEIRTNGTFEVCRGGSCSTGDYDDAPNTHLYGVLRGILALPEVSDISSQISKCVHIGSSLTNGMSTAHLGRNDLFFDPGLNWVMRDQRPDPIAVMFDCTEDGNSISFVKVLDYAHAEASEELARLEHMRRSSPPPRVSNEFRDALRAQSQDDK